MEEPAQGDGGGASDLQELRGRAALLSGGFTWPGRRPNTHRLDVKPDSGDRGHHLAKFELVQNGGFAGSIEADHEDAHVLLGHEARPDLGEKVSHLLYSWPTGGLQVYGFTTRMMTAMRERRRREKKFFFPVGNRSLGNF